MRIGGVVGRFKRPVPASTPLSRIVVLQSYAVVLNGWTKIRLGLPREALRELFMSPVLLREARGMVSPHFGEGKIRQPRFSEIADSSPGGPDRPIFAKARSSRQRFLVSF